MTENEAINVLKMVEAHGCLVIEAKVKAIQALEKQVSQKPIDKSKNPADWHVMACPCCEYVFWNSGQFFHYEPKYCDKCGQKLDWQ